jgi:putative phage-type endonuclease
MGLSEKQLLMRRTACGASEAAVIAGVSKWRTPIEIFQAKTLDARIEETLPMELGTLLEEPIASVYRKRTGKQTAIVDTIRHSDPAFAFAIATPDRAVFSGEPPLVIPGADGLSLEQLGAAERLCEIKSTTYRLKGEWGIPGTDEIPADYLCQVTWQMGVTGQKVADVAVLIDKDDFRIYTVPYQEQLFLDLYACVERFFVEHVLAGVPPPADGSKSYENFIRRMFPKETGARDKLDECPKEMVDLVKRYAVLHGAQKTLAVAVKLYRARLQTVIGEKSGFLLPWGNVTWTKDRDSMGVNWAKACAEARQIAQLLLMNFGDLLKVDEREELARRLRELESAYQYVKKKGPRKLRLSLGKEFKDALPDPRRMQLTVGDVALPGEATSLDIGQIIDGVQVPSEEVDERSED